VSESRKLKCRPRVFSQLTLAVLLRAQIRVSQQSLSRTLQPRSSTFHRHKPEETTLYKIVQENLEPFLAQVSEDCSRPLPDFVEKEFREYLKYGILAHGFLRAKYESCQYEQLVVFSCKRRGFCPSCGGRRMAESAIHQGPGSSSPQPKHSEVSKKDRNQAIEATK
jgi:hypothetical protein